MDRNMGRWTNGKMDGWTVSQIAQCSICSYKPKEKALVTWAEGEAKHIHQLVASAAP